LPHDRTAAAYEEFNVVHSVTKRTKNSIVLLLRLKSAVSWSHDIDVVMSEECSVENRTENTKHCEKLPSDRATEDNEPFTNNISKQSNDIFDITMQQQEDSRESKVDSTKIEFDVVDAGVSTKVDSGEKMTSFPSISEDVQSTNTAEIDVTDNEHASRGSVSEVTTNISDPLSTVHDLSHPKKQTKRSELLFCVIAFYIL